MRNVDGRARDGTARRRGLMIRHLAKTGIASALRWAGADALLGALTGPRGKLVVLGYHRVVGDVGGHGDGVLPGMTISQHMLAQQLDWVGRHFRFVSLDELGQRLVCGEDWSEPLAAVTFDDGYQDVYEYAFPLLREKGIPAAVFVVTDVIETSAVPLHDALYTLLAQVAYGGCCATKDLGRFLRGLSPELPKIDAPNDGVRNPFAATQFLLRALPQDQLLRVFNELAARVEINEMAVHALRPLTWEMVATMSRAGITIGSHTRTHPVLTNEAPETVLEEVAGSRWVLEQKLGIPVRHLAYPGGHFNRAVVREVADAGYRFGYTICRHRDPEYPLLTIPRTMLWETSCLDARGRFSAAIMSCQIHGIFNARCRDSHGAARIPQSEEQGWSK